jgi:hypothetical protein
MKHELNNIKEFIRKARIFMRFYEADVITIAIITLLAMTVAVTAINIH